MSEELRETKIYGAIETDSHITFTGFCKKIYSSETQEVSVFIDDEKIDTIIANNCIKEIEDKYEVFDTNSFCFNYEVPSKYIGKKHKLEFKTIENNQLLNSPSFTADKNNSKYNEYKFNESLKKRIEKRSFNNKNTIGVLISNNNLSNIDIINFIKNISNKYLVKIFCLNENEKNDTLKIFPDLDIFIINSINFILESVELFISIRIPKSNNYIQIEQYITNCSLDTILVLIDPLFINYELSKLNLEQNSYDPYIDDYKKLGLNNNYNNSSIKTLVHGVLEQSEKLNLEKMIYKDILTLIIETTMTNPLAKTRYIKAINLYMNHYFS